MAQHYPVKPFCKGSVRRRIPRLGISLENSHYGCTKPPQNFRPQAPPFFFFIFKVFSLSDVSKQTESYAMQFTFQGYQENTEKEKRDTKENPNPNPNHKYFFLPIIFISKTPNAAILIYCNIMIFKNKHSG